MKTQSADTDPIIEEKLISILRECSVPERLSRVFNMMSLTRQLSFRALRRKNPTVTKQQLDLLFVKINYGEELYKRLNNYFSKS